MCIIVICLLLLLTAQQSNAENFVKKRGVSLNQEIGKQLATNIKKMNGIIVELAAKEQKLIAQEFALCQLSDDEQESDDITPLSRKEKQERLAALKQEERALDACQDIVDQKISPVKNEKK